jgi:acetyl-CoA synthetase
MKDVSMRRCPIGPEAASEMMRELNGAALLNGYRGMPPADCDQLATIISRLSIFVAEHADAVESLEINPLLVRGSEVYAADALLKVVSE